MEVILLISLVLATIGIIYFKEDRDYIKKENERIKKVYEDSIEEQCIMRENGDCSMVKIAKDYERKYREKEAQLEFLNRLFQGLLYNFGNYEVEISEDDMNKASRAKIYIEDTLFKDAKRVKLIFSENYYDTKKD